MTYNYPHRVVFAMEFMDFGVRLAKLRTAKGVSARKMSHFIGRSDNYINKIENSKTLPSMKEFFKICEYLEITQSEFFDEGSAFPGQISELITDYRRLDDKTRSHVSGLVRELSKK